LIFHFSFDLRVVHGVAQLNYGWYSRQKRRPLIRPILSLKDSLPFISIKPAKNRPIITIIKNHPGRRPGFRPSPYIYENNPSHITNPIAEPFKQQDYPELFYPQKPNDFPDYGEVIPERPGNFPERPDDFPELGNIPDRPENFPELPKNFQVLCVDIVNKQLTFVIKQLTFVNKQQLTFQNKQQLTFQNKQLIKNNKL
jgi:hypothetical protein